MFEIRRNEDGLEREAAKEFSQSVNCRKEASVEMRRVGIEGTRGNLISKTERDLFEIAGEG